MFTATRPPAPRTKARRALALTIAMGALAGLYTGCGESAEDLLDGEDGGEDDGQAASFTSIYNSSTFQTCAGCHAPNAQGRVQGIESTQNWSTRDSAYNSLKGNASGLLGNFEACNGVPLIGDSAEESLLVAALDEDVRESFAVASAPDCNADTISDMTLKIGRDVPASLLTQLKAWIDAGAPNN